MYDVLQDVVHDFAVLKGAVDALQPREDMTCALLRPVQRLVLLPR